jgi:hypothetical protein
LQRLRRRITPSLQSQDIVAGKRDNRVGRLCLRIRSGAGYGTETHQRVDLLQAAAPTAAAAHTKCERLLFFYLLCGMPREWIMITIFNLYKT